MPPKSEEEKAESHRLAQAKYRAKQKENCSPQELEALREQAALEERARYGQAKRARLEEQPLQEPPSQAAGRSSARAQNMGAAAAAAQLTVWERERKRVYRAGQRLLSLSAASPRPSATDVSLDLASPPLTAAAATTIRRDAAKLEAAVATIPAARRPDVLRSFLGRPNVVAAGGSMRTARWRRCRR